VLIKPTSGHIIHNNKISRYPANQAWGGLTPPPPLVWSTTLNRARSLTCEGGLGRNNEAKNFPSSDIHVFKQFSFDSHVDLGISDNTSHDISNGNWEWMADQQPEAMMQCSRRYWYVHLPEVSYFS
jgi:hypothetical protein